MQNLLLHLPYLQLLLAVICDVKLMLLARQQDSLELLLVHLHEWNADKYISWMSLYSLYTNIQWLQIIQQ